MPGFPEEEGGREGGEKGQKHPRVVKLQSPFSRSFLTIVTTDVICVKDFQFFLQPQRNSQAVAFKHHKCFLKYKSTYGNYTRMVFSISEP